MGIREDVLALAEDVESAIGGCSGCLLDKRGLCKAESDFDCNDEVCKFVAHRLRAIADKDAENVTTVSAYDLLPVDERKAIAWVREHGGLEQTSLDFAEGMAFGDIVDDIAARLGVSVAGLDSQDARYRIMPFLDRRLIPEGMEWLIESWPRFDDNEPARWEDEYENGNGNASPLHRVSLYADGRAMLGKGKTKVVLAPGQSVKRPELPVLAADGEPLEVGQTVWSTNYGAEYVVCKVGQHSVTVEFWHEGIATHGVIAPSHLTHERPDSWERLEHDAEKTVCEYFGANYDCANCPLESARCAEEVKKDIIRRAKKLAERGA